MIITYVILVNNLTTHFMKKNILLKLAITVAYIAMIATNYLANALPIGGVTTGQASDSLPNLFTPAGLTFSIWGLIYLLVAVYVLYSWGLFGRKRNKKKEKLIAKVDQLFIVNALANISWIFAWHYQIIPLSLVIMVVLLTSLILIADILNKEKFSLLEKVCLRLPFSIYFGWITVATIANVTVLLVSLNWDGFGISEEIWTIAVLLVGAAIGITRAIKDRNIPYMAVLIWAYCGIALKHATFYNAQYPNIIITLVLCLVLYGTTIGWITGSAKKG
jgi:hypothetical protein